ncbi:hypothetical protein PGIGA_G00009050 [Pangasianodon gigas]|uniref:Uncharacterized protein n=1 Tax=Pangasianodon gigas TaxID=30993 RepID=A0ACC5W6K1_PANGG|nr:hypothetical protein [Pangasianodon gigas]
MPPGFLRGRTHTSSPMKTSAGWHSPGTWAWGKDGIVQTGDTNRDLVLEVLHLLPKLRHFTHGNSCQAQPPTEMNRK